MKQLLLTTILIVLTAFSTIAIGQTHVNREWMTEFGYPDTLAWSKAIPFPTNSDFEIHVGNTLNAQQDVEVLISLVHYSGSLAWQETYSTGATHNCYGVDVVAADSMIYVVGTTDNGGNNHDVLILKYDYDGNFYWAETYDYIGLDDVATAIDIDGTDLFIAGSSHGGTTDFDYLVLKYDTAGVFDWDARYDGHDLIDVPVNIEAGWGRVAVTGASASSATNWDYTTVYFDGSNGNLEGERRDSVQGVGYDMPHDMTTDNDGNIFVTGRSSTNGIDYDIRTVKMDSALNILWSATFDFQELYDVGQTIELDDFGNVYIGGYATRANNVEEMVLIKYDENGNELWNHVQAGEDFTQPAHVMDISTSSEGDLYFLGQEMANNGFNRLVVGKIDSTGATKWQRRTKQENHELPLSLKWYNDTLIYVNSALQVGQEYVYKTRRFSQFTQDNSLVYVQDTIPAYRSKELIVRFKQNSMNVDAIDNLLGKKTEYAPLEYYLTAEAMMRVDEAVKNTCTNLTEEENVCGITAVKIFKQLTSDIDSTINRNGDTIRVPDFWTTLLLTFPESVDLQQARSSLANLNSYIAYVENNVIIEPTTMLGIDDEYFNDESQLSIHDEYGWVNNPDDPNDLSRNASIQIKEAWEIYPEAGKPEVKCGVVDLLIDFRHPDFGYDPDEGPSSTKVRGGHDFINGTPLYNKTLTEPNTFHGTECAGIIGALRNNDGEGIAGIAGGDATSTVLPNDPTYFDDKGISLYSMGIFDYTDSIGGENIPQPIQSVYDAFVMGAMHPGNGGMGLDILNNSWSFSQSYLSGVTDTNYILLKESILFANRSQTSVVASRGNGGNTAIVHPACMDDDWVLNVGGTGVNGDYASEMLNNQRPLHGGGIDVSAPANQDLIYTTLSTQAPPNSNGDPYTSFNQTSAAAPHVSGAVGLLMSYLNGNISSNSNLAPEDAELILELTAENYVNMGEYSDSIGWGKINLSKAFRLVEQPYNTLYHINANLKSLNFVSNSNIYIREPVQNDANIWVGTGTYNANVFRLEGWRNHSNILNDEDTIVAYWARPSGSDVFEEAINDSLLPRHRLTIDYLDKDSCHMHGYIYEILDGSGNTIGWFPNDTTLTVWNLLELKYTVLMRDSTAPTVNIQELKNDNTLALYPNPSTDLQTVKINGFANQKVKITLYDIQGRSHGVVYDGKLNDQNQTVELDVSHLSSGFYLYDVRLETERRALRFIKQ